MVARRRPIAAKRSFAVETRPSSSFGSGAPPVQSLRALGAMAGALPRTSMVKVTTAASKD
jgi:hypothetical protein